MFRHHTCPRCRRQFLAETNTCPHCGPSPRQRLITRLRVVRPGYWQALLVTVALVITIPVVRHYLDQAAQARAAAAAEQKRIARANAAAQEAACRANARCWGDRHIGSASHQCRRAAESRALHAVRWPEGWFALDFPGVDWHDQAAGTLIYVGSAELQNGFGAWSPYIIGCLYDTRAGRVVRVELQPGRL